MRSETAELLAEIREISLLSNLGLPASLPNKAVASWEEGLKLCNSEPWDALQLMTKNRRSREQEACM